MKRILFSLFSCFVGQDNDMVVEDCIERDRRNPLTDPRETSRSVSEMKEWTCSKVIIGYYSINRVLE